MSAGPIPLRLVEENGDRRCADRRAGERSDRRAPRSRLDTLFAATLVNQIARAETPYAHGYVTAARAPRRGIVVNVSA